MSEDWVTRERVWLYAILLIDFPFLSKAHSLDGIECSLFVSLMQFTVVFDRKCTLEESREERRTHYSIRAPILLSMTSTHSLLVVSSIATIALSNTVPELSHCQLWSQSVIHTDIATSGWLLARETTIATIEQNMDKPELKWVRPQHSCSQRESTSRVVSSLSIGFGGMRKIIPNWKVLRTFLPFVEFV